MPKTVKDKEMKHLSEEEYKDRLKFSWLEMFSNTDGKTSASAFVGTLVSLVSLILFITLMIFYFTHPSEAKTVLEFIDRLTMYFGIASGLLGLKSLGVFSKNTNVTIGKKTKRVVEEDTVTEDEE